MALSELSAAIPEGLPASLNFADLGSKFEAILEKKSIHLQPASANLFSSTGARILRFNLVSQDYLLPETFRLQALLSVAGNAVRPKWSDEPHVHSVQSPITGPGHLGRESFCPLTSARQGVDGQGSVQDDVR